MIKLILEDDYSSVTICQNNSDVPIDEWIDMFKAALVAHSFHPDLVKKYFEPEEEPEDGLL